MKYTTFDIVKILGVKQECLREWIDRGFIEPSLQKASGRGTKNLFSRQDIYKIALFQYLLIMGLSREDASSILKAIKSFDTEVAFKFKECGWVRATVDSKKVKIDVDVLIDRF